ncbi:MAG: hypothetical protein K2X93_09275, partial [Candidatus Obscuribacterales bacterium]|nr:hypothetical protein [Candidatus Obscuribacterales bacterium]
MLHHVDFEMLMNRAFLSNEPNDSWGDLTTINFGPFAIFLLVVRKQWIEICSRIFGKGLNYVLKIFGWI